MWKCTLTQKPAHIYSSLKKKTSKLQQRWLSLGKGKPTVVHPDYGILLFSVKRNKFSNHEKTLWKLKHTQ